jgi:hypothetical protein
MSSLLNLGLLAAAVSPVAAFWRLPCKAPLVVERTDPIVNPGALSSHLHTIMGGNGFKPKMDYNDTQASTCASCTVIGDMSNYWTPTMFFQHQDGTFETVGQNGGALVYYLQRAPKGKEMVAFPPGFRMIAGDPSKRSGGDDHATQAISYACLDYNGPATKETNDFPKRNCPSGLRTQVFFPSCWDGVNLDSPDHKSHVAYPIENYNGGNCPSTHPVHLISIFYEIIWNTPDFADKWYGSEQPFVYSNGDPTGYSFHGDFLNGWETDLLQAAINDCTAESGKVEDCKHFNLRPDKQAEGCTKPSVVNEVVSGTLDKLPGCNPVTKGPGPAPKPGTDCGATTELSNSTAPTGPQIDGWTYLGCGTDDYFNRALTKANTASDDMTNEKCAAFCSSKGHSVFGTEYSKECYCDDVVKDAAAPVPGVPGTCKMACAGDKTQMCGGSGVISLFQKGKADKAKRDAHAAVHLRKARHAS